MGLKLGSKIFESRLIVGTGRYRTLEIMQKCHKESETQMVTVAMRRMALQKSNSHKNTNKQTILDFIDLQKITLLPNTSGAHSGTEALRLARIAIELGMEFLKIEVMGELKSLLPDPIETFDAVKRIKTEFKDDLFLMVYTSDDPVLAQKLVETGAHCIMPAGSPIGSGRGVSNPENISMIRDFLPEIPIIVDAGIGSASDATMAMELGVDGILLNTAIAAAKEPVQMATAMKHAVIAGRNSYLAGRIPRKRFATASSPA